VKAEKVSISPSLTKWIAKKIKFPELQLSSFPEISHFTLPEFSLTGKVKILFLVFPEWLGTLK